MAVVLLVRRVSALAHSRRRQVRAGRRGPHREHLPILARRPPHPERRPRARPAREHGRVAGLRSAGALRKGAGARGRGTRETIGSTMDLEILIENVLNALTT